MTGESWCCVSEQKNVRGDGQTNARIESDYNVVEVFLLPGDSLEIPPGISIALFIGLTHEGWFAIIFPQFKHFLH